MTSIIAQHQQRPKFDQQLTHSTVSQASIAMEGGSEADNDNKQGHGDKSDLQKQKEALK